MFPGSITTCLCGQLPARAERLGKTSAEAFPPDQCSTISDENGRLGNPSSWGRFLLCTDDKLTYSAKGPTGVPAQNLSARYLNNVHNSSSRDSARPPVVREGKGWLVHPPMDKYFRDLPMVHVHEIQ